MQRAPWKNILWSVALIASFMAGSTLKEPPGANFLSSNQQLGDRSSSTILLVNQASDKGQSTTSRRVLKADERNQQSAFTKIFGGSTFDREGIANLATEALRDPNPVKRRLAFSRLLEGLDASNAAQIRDQLVSLNAGGQEWRDFNYAWGALAGEEAFQQALLTDRKDLESLITGWAASDPEGAIAQLANLPENLQDQRTKFESSIVSGLADRNRDEAANYVMELANQGRENAHRLMEIVATEVLRKDGFEAAAAWTQDLPNGEAKGEAMQRVANTYARRDPEGAAGWIEQFASEDYARDAVREIGQQWARNQPVNAVTWLDNLPSGEGQKAGLNSAFGDWEDKDPVAAGQYLMSMEPSAKRDSAISGFANGYAYQDPETSIAWANDISDPNLRVSTLTRAGQVYFRRDPEAAKTWLASSGLSAEVQQAIQNPPRRRR